ncbi:MAG: hypothetical protein HQL01_11825 [Nitrospirae bacterium]|nr:hypothetical protein [Nitrospirota bacterium]
MNGGDNENDRENNPVWDVYDEYRTARLNVLGNEMQLKWLEKKNKWMEIIIAVSTSSTVAGLWIFDSTVGAYY